MISRSQAEFEPQMVEAAIASAVNAIIITDDQGRIQRANPATERRHGIC